MFRELLEQHLDALLGFIRLELNQRLPAKQNSKRKKILPGSLYTCVHLFFQFLTHCLMSSVNGFAVCPKGSHLSMYEPEVLILYVFASQQQSLAVRQRRYVHRF